MPWLRRRRGRVETQLWISELLIEELESEASEHAPDETGGMLVGYWGERGDAVITSAIGAGPAAIRKRTRFVPDGRWQQEQLDEIYRRSGRIHTFLGDWHSHPRGALRPSFRDRETAKNVAATAEARAPQPLTLIGGRSRGHWRWAAFVYRPASGFQPLRLARYETREIAAPATSVDEP